MQQPNLTQPFSCTYSPNIPELLTKLNCSLAISTYQAGKLIFISPKNEEHLVQLPRTFNKPMGIALDNERGKLGLACKDSIELFQNSKDLAEFYPRAPKKYDALFMPRVSYNSGGIDIHDLSFGKNEQIFGVNTLFSCIVKIDNQYNFTPYWKPSFISKLVSEDRCHLNGMAMENGLPKYATSFNQGDAQQSWRGNITKTGTVINVTTNEVLNDSLAMPHSPIIINKKLYILLSATGQLVEVDTVSGKQTEIINLGGFVRGMAHFKDYLFIGLSKLRKNSSTFAKLDIAEKANFSGISVVHLPTGSFCGQIKYHTSVDEIYDIEVIPNMLRPNIINSKMPESKLGISIPNQTFWAKLEADEKSE
ncbi:MAG: TIGR03032 family protein [Crocinitomicaceae bacterium]